MADSIGVISVERSLEAWEEVQRQGQDLADRLAQGFTGLIQSHIPNPKLFHLDAFSRVDFGLLNHTPFPAYHRHRAAHPFGVSDFFDIGNRIGQAGADLGAGLNALVHQFFRGFPLPFKQEECLPVANSTVVDQDLGLVTQRLRYFGFLEDSSNDDYDVSINNNGAADASTQPPPSGLDDYTGGFDLKSVAHLAKPPGTINITSTYDSSTHNIESSLVARGDLWRVEASHGGSTSASENSSLFLIQLGPVLFVRDTTLLLPVHLSKQHLLWYGFDRKNGIHSLCPAVWSKHRRWLIMSMLCLNPLACSFVDLQFPNGQLTYVSGEGLTTSAFLPLCGGLLQAHGQYPGEMRFSYSRKNKWGTRITPMVQWPDKSFSLGFAQALAWQRSGIMVKPTVQFSLCPTFGGTNPGLRAELIHSVNEQLNLICGCAFMAHPSAFASISIGRSKWNGNVGNSGIVVRVDTPLSNVGQPSLSVQINSGVEF